MATCKKCEHYNHTTRSCGTLGIGTRVLVEGIIEVNLCGCVMPIKTKLKTSRCPLGRWKAQITESDLSEIREFVNKMDGKRVTGHQNAKLTALWNKASGKNRKVTNCSSCVREMIKDLNKIIKQNDE